MGADTIVTLLGCGGHLVGGMGSGIISVSSELKPGDILDTVGEGFIFVLFQNHLVKDETEAQL